MSTIEHEQTISSPPNPGLPVMRTTTAASSGVEQLPLRSFVWGAGIECSFLPHLNVDQFCWTQHNRFWKEDLRLAREDLGLTHLRYALPWHQLEPQRGQFDWSSADQRIQECDRLGIKLMMDVMHFGTPLWLKQAVGDPEFPEALEAFAEAFVTRYRASIDVWCPFNEPLVSALFSGDFGFWPPHLRKWRGYMPVLSRIVQGVNRAIRAIRRAKPEATVLLCDAAENYKSRNKQLAAEVARRNLRRFVVMDLLLGRVDANHPLHSWLTSFGMSELDLEWFRANPQAPDILGLDYYTHSDWQLDVIADGSVRQRRAENPVGIYGVANQYWKRYGIPLLLSETSVEGQPLNREIWLESNVEQIRRLREEGVPMLGLIWWPMLDQIDWDGAMTHRIGKIHEVGLFNLKRQPDGALARCATPLVKLFKEFASKGEESVGKLESINYPSPEAEDEQLPPIGEWIQPTQAPSGKGNGNGNGDGQAASRETTITRMTAAPAASAERAADLQSEIGNRKSEIPQTDRYGIVVFCHLRWGFVWQRPQQFLSRFARKHQILFIEEPFFDQPEGAESRVDYHRVMPNVTVVTPHCSASWNRNAKLPAKLLEWTKEAINHMNEDGAFDKPLLWYYSPMDSAWSLGQIENRGVVYDCMDELSQFTGAPRQLVQNEARLIEHADVVFTGGYELGDKKRQQHDNVHTFGCGVEFEHFNKANDPNTGIPADIDFMARPIFGWFGVVDERVDYALVGEVARLRPDWSFAMVGPVVKVDPNLLPHSPNLFFMGGRDYQILPNYCRAFDVCMMPFAMNASTQFINPTKALEYMATGRPIISTPVRDVVRQWSDIVSIVRTADEFIAAAEKLLKQSDKERIERGLELARKSSWENTVKTMQGLIKDAIGKSDRRSRRAIAPLTKAELEYQYQYTPGS
jgi:beta-glucosidase/6-phospho-beta-glucosidase/beta-galactosidase/glycosyltransferase involved in cell wall biosynthesis